MVSRVRVVVKGCTVHSVKGSNVARVLGFPLMLLSHSISYWYNIRNSYWNVPIVSITDGVPNFSFFGFIEIFPLY